MFYLLNQYSKGKVAWYLLIFSVVILQAAAIYFQITLYLEPCSLCIYQRIALMGILFAGIVGFIGSKNLFFRNIAILGWLFSAYKGFDLAYLQARLQFAPRISDSCSLGVRYPKFLPLDEWLPIIFKATDQPCSKKVWSFLTLEMSQWMMIIFCCYLIIGTLVMLSQMVSPPNTNTIWKN